MNLFYAIFYGLISQVLSFIAIQGSYKIQYLKDNLWIPILLGIPTSYLVIKSVHYFIEAFNGEIYPSRILGFVLGIFVFSIMGWLMFGEKLSLKTVVCLGLCGLIMLVQMLWKTPRI
jgi:hypothetical protein